MKKNYFLLSSLLLFLIGFFCYQSFFEILIMIVGLNEVEFISNNVSSRFVTQIVFAIILTCLPALYYCVQKITKINLWFDGAYVIAIITFFGTLFSIFRGIYIYEELIVLSGIKFNDAAKLSYSIDNFNFEYYVLLGFVFGGILSLSLLSLRRK